MISGGGSDDRSGGEDRRGGGGGGGSGGKVSSNLRPSEKLEHSEAWGIVLFSLIGATATTLAVCRLRRTVDWVYSELFRSSSTWKNTNNNSYYAAWKEDSYKRYNRRMQEEYEDEMERVERIRRMQSVFNRERNKYKNSYENWRENGDGPGPYQYYQHAQRDDWYWKSDTTHRNQRTNSSNIPRDIGSHAMSHHYSILGLDGSRTKSFSDAEIKKAFRAKAMEYHPDQNQNNKETAEAKFKQVMTSYEAIKSERGNGKL